MTEEVPVRVKLPGGVNVALCSHLCFRRWAVAAAARCPNPVPSLDGIRPAEWCTHCAYCGEQTSTPITGYCRRHDDDLCPEWDPLQTLAATVVVHELTRRAERPLNDLAMRYFHDAAYEALLEYDFPNVDRLLAIMWDRRQYWCLAM